jgi:2,3-dihydroxyphenylpropionate 1,2-dioxygenase
MAKVVGGISVSHAPGITGWADAPSQDERQAVFGAFDRLKNFVDDAKPDLIIAFLDDHFDIHFRGLMPAISVGVASEHIGPGPEYYELLKMDETRTYDGEPELAEELLKNLVSNNFDAARTGKSEFGNNLAVPAELIFPDTNIPLIPVFINVFTPPIISARRAYDLGRQVREAVEGWDRSVLFLGTGGLSHWPPVWYAEKENDPFLERMGRYQELGRDALEIDPTLRADVGPYEIQMAQRLGDKVVNPEWDQAFLRLVREGDVEGLTSLTYDEIEEGGGHGGHEVLNWIAVAGSMNGAPAEQLVYAPTPEWICGTGAMLYSGQS